eukprot:CFRG3086T1
MFRVIQLTQLTKVSCTRKGLRASNATRQIYSRVGKDDLYSLLGVAHSATQEQIKDKYRKLVLQLHPDRNIGKNDTTARFTTISEAYEILGDESKRRVYNRENRIGVEGIGSVYSNNSGAYTRKPTRMESEVDLKRARDLHHEHLRKRAENDRYIDQLKESRANEIQGRYYILATFALVGMWMWYINDKKTSRRKHV